MESHPKRAWGVGGPCISITELDKVLVTSDTSEIAVYGGWFGRRAVRMSTLRGSGSRVNTPPSLLHTPE